MRILFTVKFQIPHHSIVMLMLTAGTTAMANAAKASDSTAKALMPGGWSDVDSNVFGAVMSAVDDAATYSILRK